jgi:hypothetical protein
MTSYAEFIAAKTRRHGDAGITIEPGDLHPSLFDFQKAATSWALRKGRACLFAGTGLGKTRMQVEYARHIPGIRLIVAPLAVAGQTIEEAASIGVKIEKASGRIEREGVYIVNYDRLHTIEAKFDAVVLDESSILKSHDGKFRNYITERFQHTPYKLACTATPAPNDYMELGTHAEFVGACSRQEMLATYFMHDGGDTALWRLKRHAKGDFWTWVASWACVFSHPSDLGYSQDGYDLPSLTFHDSVVEVESSVGGGLFGDEGMNATRLYASLRESASERVAIVAGLVSKEPDRPWLIWVNTDAEQDLVERLVPGITSVRGSDPSEIKEDRLLGFASGKYQMLVTKPKIAGFGMNWQHCNRMVFCGVTYSFEQMYQAIRRSWRFGQTQPVDVHLVTCNAQDSVRSALKAKEEAFTDMAREMSRYCIQEVSK